MTSKANAKVRSEKRVGKMIARKEKLMGGNADRRIQQAKVGIGLFGKQHKHSTTATRNLEPLPFYSLVVIGASKKIPAAARRHDGVVVGRAQTKSGNWNYSVSVRELNRSYYLARSSLKPTGKVLKREDLYSGDIIRVRVAADGAGTEVVTEETVTSGQKG